MSVGNSLRSGVDAGDEQEFTWERGGEGHSRQREQREQGPCCIFRDQPRSIERGEERELWVYE